ncbi:YdcF family protein [Flavobacteriaceae bacterium]|nr:YdcF family protein [Flavobacteriaceae bacterium]
MGYDCIIVLANEMDIDGNLNHDSLSRLNQAVKTYFSNSSSYLITCGWNYRKDSSLYIGNVMRDYAIRLGVPPDKIITELNPRDTVGDAFFTKQNILFGKGWKKLLVVTSDYHVNRTSIVFRFIYGSGYNIDVIGSESQKNDYTFSEMKSLESFKKTFKNLKSGDNFKIYERMLNKHPFYNGDVYPKINLTLRK